MAVKTVVCKECGAEQAILRDEEGKMNCVFCGAPMDLPAYEEGEELNYAYDHPEEAGKPPVVTPEGERIDAVFVLNEDEVGAAFAAAGKMKERKVILIVETVLLAAVGVATLVMNILGLLGKAGLEKPQVSSWLFVALCFGMLPVIWILPRRTKRKIIRNATSGNQLTVSVYENVLNIHIDGREDKDDWQQPLDGSFGLVRQQGLFVLSLSSGQLLVIPERSLTEEQVDVVARRLAPPAEETPAEPAE